MAKLIETDTRLEAWMVAADHLLDHGPMLNLILAIESPAVGGSNAAVDDFLASRDQFSMHTVAETIFPGFEYRRRGLQGVLDFYPEKVYPAIEKHPAIRWGTYAYRLVRRPDASGNHINPLKQLIEKMKSEIKTPGPKDHAMNLALPKVNTTYPSTVLQKTGSAAWEVPVFPIFLSSCSKRRCI